MDNISPVYQLTSFYDSLISYVCFYCTHRKEIDESEKRRMASQVKINERHSKLSDEELARKCNVEKETERYTINATTQRGVWTSMEPMCRRVKVDHLDLHHNRLKGN